MMSRVDNSVFLIGRPPLGEFLGHVASQAADEGRIDQRALANEWRSANDHVRELEKLEAHLPDSVRIEPVPAHAQHFVRKVEADPLFSRSFTTVPTDVQLVELEKLVVFQKNIDLEHVARLKADLGPKPSEEAIYKLCLPWDHPAPQVNVGRISGNAYVFVSPSNDLRFLGPQLFQQNQLAGEQFTGSPAGVLGLAVGFGSNYLNVVKVGNRLILNNGSHRAYALRDFGVTMAPAVVQHTTRKEELEVIVPNIAANPEPFTTAPRPPMLKDYFDPKLRKLLPIPRKARNVRVIFQVEQVDTPVG